MIPNDESPGLLFCEKSCGRKAVIVNTMICKCEIPSKVELQNLTNLTAIRRTPPVWYKMTRLDQIGSPVALAWITCNLFQSVPALHTEQTD